MANSLIFFQKVQSDMYESEYRSKYKDPRETYRLLNMPTRDFSLTMQRISYEPSLYTSSSDAGENSEEEIDFLPEIEPLTTMDTQCSIKCPLCRTENPVEEHPVIVLGSNDDCSVCQSAKAKIVLTTCHHLCLCDDCYKQIDLDHQNGDVYDYDIPFNPADFQDTA
jgi:hypothetical protein